VRIRRASLQLEQLLQMRAEQGGEAAALEAELRAAQAAAPEEAGDDETGQGQGEGGEELSAAQRKKLKKKRAQERRRAAEQRAASGELEEQEQEGGAAAGAASEAAEGSVDGQQPGDQEGRGAAGCGLSSQGLLEAQVAREVELLHEVRGWSLARVWAGACGRRLRPALVLPAFACAGAGRRPSRSSTAPGPSSSGGGGTDSPLSCTRRRSAAASTASRRC
jgi:hypothetical protein